MRPQELPTHLALCRYLYRLENDMPKFAWGLRQDLPERMARPGFHALPASQADLWAQHGLPQYDGQRQESAGVLAILQALPSLPSPAVVRVLELDRPGPGRHGRQGACDLGAARSAHALLAGAGAGQKPLAGG